MRMKEISHCGLGDDDAACSLARGRYIGMMDADDVSLPDRLRLEVDFMEKYPRVGLLGAAVQWMNAAGCPLMSVASPRVTENCGRPRQFSAPFGSLPFLFAGKPSSVQVDIGTHSRRPKITTYGYESRTL